MSWGGSVQAMINSLKNNKALRSGSSKGRWKDYKHNLKKKSPYRLRKMNEEELKVVRMNKKRIEREAKMRLITAIAMIIILIGTITFFLLTAH